MPEKRFNDLELGKDGEKSQLGKIPVALRRMKPKGKHATCLRMYEACRIYLFVRFENHLSA